MPHPNPDRLCLHDSQTVDGKLFMACKRPAIPGRWLCSKHAGQVARRRKVRARR